MMHTIARNLGHNLFVASALLIATMSTLPGTLDLNVAEPPVGPTYAERVSAITAGLHCTGENEPRLVDVVIVVTEAGHLSRVTFDEAYTAASDGLVRVVAYCD